MMRRWKSRTRMTSGIVTTMDAAVIWPQGYWDETSAPLNCAMETVAVSLLSCVMKVRAKRNSFHA